MKRCDDLEELRRAINAERSVAPEFEDAEPPEPKDNFGPEYGFANIGGDYYMQNAPGFWPARSKAGWQRSCPSL